MKPDDITISGGRYWSVKLHGDAFPRKVGGLLKCDHGTYTATVDGKAGVLTIAADGWWFTQAETQPQAPVIAPPPSASLAQHDALVIAALKVDLITAHGLLSRWLDIDDWGDDAIAPRDLALRTRQALTRAGALSPAKPGTPAATPATDPEAPAHAS